VTLGAVGRARRLGKRLKEESMQQRSLAGFDPEVIITILGHHLKPFNYQETSDFHVMRCRQYF